MIKIMRIAFKNLYRQKRRTMLTVFIIAFGVIAVLLFSAIAGSFKSMMVGQITDSMLGHIQIHRKGYVESLDNMPLNLVIQDEALDKTAEVLDEIPTIEGFSFRILFGGMLSDYRETTNIKLAALDPEKEKNVIPLLGGRIKQGRILKEGEIVLPDLITKGLKLKLNSDVVIIANNADGSVNGQGFKLSGIIESAVGPSGKYGYIHINDAKTILRMMNTQISEIAIRLKDLETLPATMNMLNKKLSSIKDAEGNPLLEIHPWMKLTPFYNIAQMIDMMALFIKVILITIVLISIMNVMIMAVYERVKEIGTMSAIGTPAAKIKLLFIYEGLFLGIIGAVSGTVIGLLIIAATRAMNLTVAFGRTDDILLKPFVGISEIIIVAVIVIIISAIAVIQPAFKASKLEPIDALRQ
ncbi:MAG: ABC transporter permease [Spirochaetes bacterium]|nr:ABC transporter permease [Spirochaetota bacterium]